MEAQPAAENDNTPEVKEASQPVTSIKSAYIHGYKCLDQFAIDLNPGLNIIVGNNETGKSSILEAIDMAISGKLDGKPLSYTLHPHMFNKEYVEKYFAGIKSGEQLTPPHIHVEIEFVDNGDPEMATMMGGENRSKQDKAIGVSLKVEVDPEARSDFDKYIHTTDVPHVVPVEFYRIERRYFSGSSVNPRTTPLRSSVIDTSKHRSFHDPDRYLGMVTKDILSDEQQREVSAEFRRHRHMFQSHDAIKSINEALNTNTGGISKKTVSLGIDVSPKSDWESSVTTHLDQIPFAVNSKGEQSQVKMKLALITADTRSILLIEEPENHLSHSNLNNLLGVVDETRATRQAICTTHSSFVLNKLGLTNLHLISASGRTARLSDLTPGTERYFKRLPGYSTLRVLLARRSILVEGPTDELIVQRAYLNKYGKLPLEDGVDVISVQALAFLRPLEIAKLLDLDVRVVTDNDGNVDALKKKYADYLGQNAPDRIKVCFDDDEDAQTLENQVWKINTLDQLNRVLNRKDTEMDQALEYMKNNKTEWALRVFESEHTLETPDYIDAAISY